jgi:hypothetical protein
VSDGRGSDDCDVVAVEDTAGVGGDGDAGGNDAGWAAGGGVDADFGDAGCVDTEAGHGDRADAEAGHGDCADADGADGSSIASESGDGGGDLAGFFALALRFADSLDAWVGAQVGHFKFDFAVAGAGGR